MNTHTPTHGSISEPYGSAQVVTHDRKGREGMGRGREEGCVSSIGSSRREVRRRAVGSQQATTRAAQMDEEMFGGGL